MSVKRPVAFVLAATNHGTMIVNRHDYRMTDATNGYGVGYQLLNASSFDPEEVNFALAVLSLRRQHHGDGVTAIDCGANIGVHTVDWSRHMHGWGYTHAFEAQERVFYALAGNLAINNCLNASAYHAAVGSECGQIKIPVADSLVPASFGSLEIKQHSRNEFIGQALDYTEAAMQAVALTTIDSQHLSRVDFIKIDVEGMEIEVLKGAAETIQRSKPAMMIEIIKSDRIEIEQFLSDYQYLIYPMGINILAVHAEDGVNQHLTMKDGVLNLNF